MIDTFFQSQWHILRNPCYLTEQKKSDVYCEQLFDWNNFYERYLFPILLNSFHLLNKRFEVKRNEERKHSLNRITFPSMMNEHTKICLSLLVLIQQYFVPFKRIELKRAFVEWIAAGCQQHISIGLW